MAFIRSVLHMLIMAVTVIPYSLAVLYARFKKDSRAAYTVARAWLALSIKMAHDLLHIQTNITGMENLPEDKQEGVVLLVKHQSTYETFLLPAIMPRPLAYVFKKELLRVPFFGWAIGALDMIHIDRSQGKRAFSKVMQQGRMLLDMGHWVVMFPEGTRMKRGRKGEYKSGGARLAITAGVSVVPIAITSGRVWPRKAFVKRPGTVDISIGKPIPSKGREREELMAEVEQWIEAEMRRLDPDAYKDRPAGTPQSKDSKSSQTNEGMAGHAVTPHHNPG